MQVACCQLDIAWENKPANYAKVQALVAAAKLPAGTLLLLPEMFATGFSMDVALAESLEGPSATFLSGLARQHGVFVLGGLAVSPGAGHEGRPRNEALLFDPAGRLLSRYAKMQLFRLAGESDHYAAGNVPGVLPLPQCTGQVAICYDLRFPEVFRGASGPRPELLALIANWPDVRASHWLALLKARAIENQAYVAAVNRCGSDPKHTYPGRSQIIAPGGEVLADAGDGEGIIRAELDWDSLRTYREKFPALADVREDLIRREE